VRAVPVMLTLAAALGAPIPAFAANIDKDIPYANFTAADKAIFQKALDGALDQGADGVTRSWTNADTNARGDIRPTKSFERDGRSCRTVTISNHAKGRSASGPFTFCKAATGKWGLATAASKAEPPKAK
jgi:surface antigen